MPPWIRKSKKSITAAAGNVIEGGSPASPDSLIARQEDWQKRVLAYISSVPEAAHVLRFTENTCSKAKITFKGEGAASAVADIGNLAIERLNIGRVCAGYKSIGQAILVLNTTTLEWDVLGVNDYQYQGGSKSLLVKDESGKFVPLSTDHRYFKTYREDPADRHKPWSTFKALLDVLEAMYLHQLADTSIAQSRLALSGVFYVPNDDMENVPLRDGGSPEPGTQQEFQQQFTKAVHKSLRSNRPQDAVEPLLLLGPAEHADGLRHVLVERNDDARAYQYRMEALRQRFADGVDVPAEVVVGLGSANHWSSWKVDQNTSQYYLEPDVDLLARDLFDKILRPLASEMGVDASLLSYEVDMSSVTTKPDKTDAAIRLHSINALSAEGALHYAGMDDNLLHPAANQDPSGNKTQPDGSVRMPSSNFRGSEGEPIGDRNFDR